MKMKHISLLALTAILIISPFIYKPAVAATSGFKQGDQYLSGLYDLQAEFPTPFNWDRNSPYHSVESNPRIKWNYENPGFDTTARMFRGSPTVGSDGTVYATTYDGNVNAFNKEDGSLKWRFKDGHPFIGTGVVVGNGVLYAGKHAINLDGTPKWAMDVTHKGMGAKTPAIDNHGNIYSIGNRLLYSTDSTGKINWEFQLPVDADVSAPAIGSDGTIYIAKSPPTPGILAINPDGTLKWSLDVPTGPKFTTLFGSSASVSIGKDGTLYFPLTYKSVYAVNPDGTVKWMFEAPNIWSGTVIGPDGTIYFHTRDMYLYALNPDGTLKWKMLNKSPSTDIPIFDKKGIMYFGTTDFKVVALDTSTRKLLWEIKLKYTVDNGSLSIGSDGTLYASNGPYLTAITGDVYQEVDYCAIYSDLKGLTEEDLSSSESREKAKRDLELLKAELNKIENKIIQAESSQQ